MVNHMTQQVVIVALHLSEGAMTSRERVLTAFAHEEPDRVPCWCGASPEFMAQAQKELGLDGAEAVLVRFGDDFRRVSARYAGPNSELPPGSNGRTIFGINRHGHGYGQPLHHPLAGASLREIHDYPWPDPAWMDVSAVRAEAAAWGDQYAILGGDWSPFWHDAIDLLGMEELLILMAVDPPRVDAVMGHLLDFYAEVNRRIFDAAADVIDILFIGNDFGSQIGPILGPSQFGRFLMPHMRRLINLGHDYGLKVQLHCCGGIAPLLPLLVEAGIDGFHAVQPNCRGMDLATLKHTYGGRLVFNGAIDSQSVLIEGEPDLVRDAVRRTLALMAPGGGYVAGASHDYILPETPVANVVAMFDAVHELGQYPLRLD